MPASTAMATACPYTDCASLQLNIAYPANGSQKLIEIEDERKLAVFMEKRVRTLQPRITSTR